jgi:hypothetical protein
MLGSPQLNRSDEHGERRAPLEVSTLTAEQTNMAYSSTLLTHGTALGLVVATGDAPENGRINPPVMRRFFHDAALGIDEWLRKLPGVPAGFALIGLGKFDSARRCSRRGGTLTGRVRTEVQRQHVSERLP